MAIKATLIVFEPFPGLCLSALLFVEQRGTLLTEVTSFHRTLNRRWTPKKPAVSYVSVCITPNTMQDVRGCFSVHSLADSPTRTTSCQRLILKWVRRPKLLDALLFCW